MIRRESRPFTVEVRKGQKRTSQASLAEPPQSSQQGSGGESLEDIFRRAEAALFDRGAGSAAKSAAGEPSQSAAQATPGKGRILENLAEVHPLETLLAEPVQPTRRGRKPGSKNKPKPVPLASTEPPRTSDVRLSRQSQGAFEHDTSQHDTFGQDAFRQDAFEPDAFEDEVPAPQPAFVDHGVPPAPAPTAAARAEVAPVARDAATPTVRPAQSTPSAPSPSKTVSKRPRGLIRGRYVTGSELRPGERWKRRLRTGR